MCFPVCRCHTAAIPAKRCFASSLQNCRLRKSIFDGFTLQVKSCKIDEKMKLLRWGAAMSVKYKRVLLKLSGEALSGDKGFGLTWIPSRPFVKASKTPTIWVLRSRSWWAAATFGAAAPAARWSVPVRIRSVCWATAMNALAVADALEHLGVEVRVQTALSMQQIAEPYIRNRPSAIWKKGESSFWPAERATRSFPRTQLRRCALRRSTRISSSRRRWWTAFTTATPTSSTPPCGMTTFPSGDAGEGAGRDGQHGRRDVP